MKKTIITILLLLTNLIALDSVLETNVEIIKCKKSTLYELEENMTRKLNVLKRNFETLDKTCQWEEQYNISKKEQCIFFKNKKDKLSSLNIEFENNLNDFKEQGKKWKKYIRCESSLRLLAKQQDKRLSKIIKSLYSNISSYKECEINIKQQINSNCNMKFRQPFKNSKIKPKYNKKQLNNNTMYINPFKKKEGNKRKRVILLK